MATQNDAEAQTLLLKLGLLEKLQNVSREKSTLASGATTRLDVWEHASHWITAFRYSGFVREEDNGYAVRCLPKSTVTKTQFSELVKKEVAGEFGDGRHPIELGPVKPPSQN